MRATPRRGPTSWNSRAGGGLWGGGLGGWRGREGGENELRGVDKSVICVLAVLMLMLYVVRLGMLGFEDLLLRISRIAHMLLSFERFFFMSAGVSPTCCCCA